MDMKWDHQQQLLSSLHQNLTNANSSFQMLTFSSKYLWCILQKEPRTGTLVMQVMTANGGWWPCSLFLEVSQFLGFVAISQFGCISVMPFKPESVQMFLAPSQNPVHTVLCLNFQLPTPASVFSFCGKRVHKCITVPSEEFWHTTETFAH